VCKREYDNVIYMNPLVEYIIKDIFFNLGLICILLGGVTLFLDFYYRETFSRSYFFYCLSFLLVTMKDIVIVEDIIKQVQTTDPVNTLLFRLMYIFIVGVSVVCFQKTDWTKLK